jgi:hypothetical protein
MKFPNSEMITGIALIFLSLLFIFAGIVNQVWARIFIVDFVMLPIGGGFIALGVWSERNYQKERTEEPSHH